MIIATTTTTTTMTTTTALESTSYDRLMEIKQHSLDPRTRRTVVIETDIRRYRLMLKDSGLLLVNKSYESIFTELIL